MKLLRIAGDISAHIVGYYPPNHTQEYTEDSEGGSGCFFSEMCTKCEQSAQLPSHLTTVRHVVVRVGKKLKFVLPLCLLN